MRQVINSQLEFSQVDISAIKFDPKSRDDIPKILRGLQYIYITPSLREPIFALLEKEVAPKISKKVGRPGLELWKILVLGVLRLDLNCDYDRIHGLANNYSDIRQMLGHSDFYDKYEYNLQTIKDNLSLLTEDLLGQINTIVVTGGHDLVKKKPVEPVLHGRCDSFVVETNVHYPTDTNLLFDAMRKALSLSSDVCVRYGLTDLRQYQYNIRQIKHSLRVTQKAKRSAHRTTAGHNKVIVAHQDYIKLCTTQLSKIELVLATLEQEHKLSIVDGILVKEIRGYIVHAKRQIDQVERRIIHGEIIPHDEKVFSIFEPHTEWISKGKAGVPVEFGIRVCIMEDQHQFILHHRVMEHETDDKVTVKMVDDSQKKFAHLRVVSFDKGFHSPDNQEQLKDMLTTVALPRKGRLSQVAKQLEQSAEFRDARKKHSAVESAINSLEVHGLDVCPDHGINGFRRYVALAIVTHNIHRIGAILDSREKAKHLRLSMKRKSATASPPLLAA